NASKKQIKQASKQASKEEIMAAGDTPITIIGNLVDDPQLRFTQNGSAVANFRVASTPRYRDQQTGEWQDGEPLFMTCTIWRQAAENVAESLQRGARVIVNGRLKQRSFENQQGEKRTVYEVDADEVGPSLRYASAKVTKTTRSGGGTGGSGGQVAANGGDDPWSTAANQPTGPHDEPPF